MMIRKRYCILSRQAQLRSDLNSQPDKNECERGQHEDCCGRPAWNRHVGPVAGSRLCVQRHKNSQVVKQPDGARHHENQNERPGSHGGARRNDVRTCQ